MIEYENAEQDIKYGFVIAGVVLMISTCLLFIFIDTGAKEIIGLVVLLIIGLSLVVAGSPDPNRRK